MRKTLLAAYVATGFLGATSAFAATLQDLSGVVNWSQFQLSVNNNALNQYSITVDNLPVVQAGQLTNLRALETELALKSTIQTGTKGNGTPFATVTLNSDVNVVISQSGTQIAQLTFQQGLSLSSDPAISTPISFLNTSGSIQTYSVSVPLIFSPSITSPATKVKGSLTGTLRDNPGSTVPADGATIAPLGGSIVTTTLLGAGSPNMLVDVGNTQTFAANTGVDNYASQFNPGPTFTDYKAGPVPSPSFTGMIQTISFSLTPRDRATMVAFSEIIPVPEPSSYLLMATGVIVLLGVARDRRTRLS